MLRLVIFLIFMLSIVAAFSSLGASPSCLVIPLKDKEVLKEIEMPFKGKSCETQYLTDIQKFQEDAIQMADDVLKDKDFQDFVAGVRGKKTGVGISSSFENVPLPQNLPDSTSRTPVSCYVFVSFSLSEKALLNLALEAKKWGATLVLRGFRDGSYRKTALALQNIISKTEQGFIIDPEFFTLFAVTAVPTIILSKSVPLLTTERIQTPLHDRLQGHVSLHYALETFAKEGDLKQEAHLLLKQGISK